jgi:hypothetical protein
VEIMRQADYYGLEHVAGGCPCCGGGKCECPPGCGDCSCKGKMSSRELEALLTPPRVSVIGTYHDGEEGGEDDYLGTYEPGSYSDYHPDYEEHGVDDEGRDYFGSRDRRPRVQEDAAARAKSNNAMYPAAGPQALERSGYEGEILPDETSYPHGPNYRPFAGGYQPPTAPWRGLYDDPSKNDTFIDPGDDPNEEGLWLTPEGVHEDTKAYIQDPFTENPSPEDFLEQYPHAEHMNEEHGRAMYDAFDKYSRVGGLPKGRRSASEQHQCPQCGIQMEGNECKNCGFGKKQSEGPKAPQPSSQGPRAEEEKKKKRKSSLRTAEEELGLFSIMDDPKKWTDQDPMVSTMLGTKTSGREGTCDKCDQPPHAIVALGQHGDFTFCRDHFDAIPQHIKAQLQPKR